MFRRKFLSEIARSAAGLLAGGGFFSKLMAGLMGKYITIKKQSDSGWEKKLSSIEKNKTLYISLNEFAHALDYGVYTNTSKRKTVLYIGQEKVTFTADNGFIILNEQIYQFLFQPIWYHSEIWIPIPLLEELFTSYTSHQLVYDKERYTIVLGSKDVNISNIAITAKKNGTLIQFFSQKRFSRNDITLKIANGWLHVEVYGGKADSETLTRQKTGGVVSEIEVIQFDSLVSMAFRLKKPLISKELILSDANSDFMVNLRTKDTIDQDQQAKEELDRQKKEWLVDTIVIDPGHGGKDPGAVGYKNLYEKTIVLKVALQLGKMINKNLPNVKVVYTRNKDVFIPVWKRTKIANENKGKLFVSLHCNSLRNKRIKGFETYFLSSDEDKNKQAQEVVLKENASIEFENEADKERYKGINFILATMAQNAFIKQSQYLASSIQKSYASKLKPLGLKDRGVKQGRFWVLVGATMPNVLVEMGFISNKNDANFLKKTSNIKKVAEALYTGISKYKKDVESSI